MSDDGYNAPYKVGYRKPPASNRFKKGQSGNPGGRPKKLKSWSEIVAQELQRKIVVREGGKIRRLTKQEAIAARAVNSAYTDLNLKALKEVGGFAELSFGEIYPPSFTLKLEDEPEEPKWSDDDDVYSRPPPKRVP